MMLATTRKSRDVAVKENMSVVRKVVRPQRRSCTVLEEVTQPSHRCSRVEPARRSRRSLIRPNYTENTTMISTSPYKATGWQGKLKNLDAEEKDQHVNLEDKQDDFESRQPFPQEDSYHIRDTQIAKIALTSPEFEPGTLRMAGIPVANLVEKVRDQVFGLSKYELMIQRNIAKKRKFMDSLGIFKAKEDLELGVSKPVKRPCKKRQDPPVVRRSLRQQNLTPDGVDLPQPTERQVNCDEEYHHHPRPPPGPGPVTEYCRDEDLGAMEGLLQEVHEVVAKGTGGHMAWAGSVESVVRRMRKMVVQKRWVMKVVPNRTFAIQIHPSMAKTLVLVGAKWGGLGVWDIERKDQTSRAHFFNPHSRPINCLTVDPSCPNHIYTTSYDGSVRRTDLEACVVEQVYSHVPENDNSRWVSWHSHMDQNILLVAASDGKIVQVDLREGNTKRPRAFLAHDSWRVKVVTQHPVNTHYFASAARNSVRLWDVRNMKANNPVADCPHGRLVCGLEFSPVTGNSLISTSLDDHLRFISCDLSSLKVSCMIRHNNKTGRWLTNFNARFVPGRDDLVVVGSMMHPRRVEVWDSEGGLQHNFLGEHLGSVTSVVALHPGRPVLAGANSSGKVYVFM